MKLLVLQLPAVTFEWTLTLDTLLLFIATVLIAIATYLMYRATRETTRTLVRPKVIAWLREKEKGLGIYVQSVGLGTSYNGKVTCTTDAGSVTWGFTRMFIGQIYEYPIKGQSQIPFSAVQGVSKMKIQLSYEDINGHRYDEEEFEVDVPSDTPLGQV